MIIGAVLSLGLAVLIGGSGLWTLARRPVTDLTTQVVRMVETSGDQVHSIAAAAEQQSATSEEINRAISSISSIADATDQGMAQCTVAIADLTKQANELERLITSLSANS